MNRFVKNPWSLALAVTVVVAILSGTAQALPNFHENYRSDVGTGHSGWAPAGVQGHTFRLLNEQGTIMRTTPYGDAGVFNLGEGHPTMEGPALVQPGGHHFEFAAGNTFGDVGECDPAAPVPEPETFVLVGLGLLGIVGLARAQG